MRLQRWLVLVVLIVFAGCGGDDSSTAGGAGGADPATAIPAGVPVYVEAVVRPEGEQGDNARELLERFLGDKSITDLIDEQLEEDDQTYTEDVEPWLGERAGIGLTDLAADEPSFIGAVAVTDAEKAEAAIAESKDVEKGATYEDVPIYMDSSDEDSSDDSFVGITEEFAIITETEAQLKEAIDGLGEQSLEQDARFTEAFGKLPEERLGALYLDTQAFGDAIAADETLEPAAKGVLDQLFGDGPPLTAALTAQPDAATIESRLPNSVATALGPFATGTAPEILADAPAGTWGVVGYTDVGETLKTTLETFAGALGGAALSGQLEAQTGLNADRDIFSWIGDISVFVRGETVDTLDGAIVIEASDQDAAAAAFPRIIAAARTSGAPVAPAQVDGADQAFSVPLPDAPGPIVMATNGELVVLSLGEQAAQDALDPTETIADSGLYERAKGAVDGIAPATIFDFSTILSIAEAEGSTDADYEEAKPYLEQLDLLVAGAVQDGDEYRSLFTITVK
ncbi:MAG: DUF3352 domain-containing protein [Solirubrobacteraceae bacterium]